MTTLDEIQNIANRTCAHLTSLTLLNEKAIERIKGEMAQSANASPNKVESSVVDAEREPLTAQQLYEKIKQPGEWEKFLEAQKPQLEAQWRRPA